MAMEAAVNSTAPGRPGLPGVIVAATIGNVLEWFDFLVYGFFAVTIAEVFFPVGNPTVSLLITFGTFGLSYLVRPLGARSSLAPIRIAPAARRGSPYRSG